MARGTPLRARSARARGLRTLQHQTLPAVTYYAIDTEVWFRGLILQHAAPDPPDPRWATKDQVHDEAMAWFLEQYAQHPFKPHAVRRRSDADLTFWLDSKLMGRARRIASRDGIKLARLIEAALTAYVTQHVPREMVAFRRRVQREARTLYESLGTRVTRARRKEETLPK